MSDKVATFPSEPTAARDDERQSLADARLLEDWLREAHDRTNALIEDLDDRQLIGPRLAIVNPLLWEVGHVAWFHERFTLRHACGRRPLLANGDRLYDSSAVAHDTRWELPLPSRRETLAYRQAILEAMLEVVQTHANDPRVLYFAAYTVFHEDMHDEAFTYTRQTLGYPPPSFARTPAPAPVTDEISGDAVVAAGRYRIGSERDAPFAFDNEKWAHTVALDEFAISRHAVTEEEFRAFVEDGGYRRRALWSQEGWRWRVAANAEHPVYWTRSGKEWLRRRFDAWIPLEPRRAMLHVNWFEADAYCRWAKRRLPAEAEWEAAARFDTDAQHTRMYPWGDAPPAPARANLDWRAGDCVAVDACAAGDSALGIRQMLGNVWEWTATDFAPYPGFTPDAYRDYSRPWFYTHKVLRGGCWATRSRLIRNAYRNYATPDRRDIWAGFRTVAL